MKKSFALVLSLFVAIFAFAGDAAFFDDIGFSQDGNFYLFGQYGKTDKKYQAWAEIYTVDVAANEFVKNEVYKVLPGQEKSERSGKEVYTSLKNKNEYKFAKYNAKPAAVETFLYLRESQKKDPLEEIVFKDFEGSTVGKEIFYHVKLVPTYEGSGENTMSKFYIDLKTVDQNGNVIMQKKVGTPDFKRKGVTAYQIDKIFTDSSKKSLVFIVQKTTEDKAGKSIRYMVETAKF